MADVDIIVQMIDKTKSGASSVRASADSIKATYGNAGKYVDELGDSFQKYVTAVTQSNAANEEAGKSAKGAASSLAQYKKEAVVLAPAIENAKMKAIAFASANAGLIGVIVGVGVALKKAWEFSAEGAKLQRLADTGAEVARQYGGNMDLIIQKVKEASLGTVSEMDIIASANRAMMLGLSADSDKLANLMEIAAFRGRAMGLDTTQAFNDIVTGIGRASPLILDNLGIVVNAKETYKKYAENIGKSASELTKAEKTQALLNAVLEEGNNLLDEAGGLVLDNAGKVEKLNATWKNFIDNRKRENEDFAGSVSEMASTAIAGWDEYFKYLDAQGQIRDIAKEMTGGSVELITPQIYEEARRQWVAQQQVISEVNTELERNAELAAIAAEELQGLSKANAELIDNAIKLTDENKKYQDTQQGILDQIVELKDEKDGYYSWEIDKIQATQDKIDDLSVKYDENAEAFIEAQNKKLAMMAIEAIALEDGIAGYSQAEYEKAKAILETTDVATAAAFEQAQAQQVLIDGLIDAGVKGEDFGRILQEVGADGVISMGEVAAALAAIPSEKSVTISVNTAYAGADLNAIAAMSQNRGRGSGRRNATGGTYTIPAMWGNEGFPIGNSDTASGGELISITPRGKDPNAAVVEAINANRIDEKKLARSIVAAMAQAGG